jgi:hypothetical protein
MDSTASTNPSSSVYPPIERWVILTVWEMFVSCLGLFLGSISNIWIIKPLEKS